MSPTTGSHIAATAGDNVASARPQRRLIALDGLRGLAALVVVFHHSLLTWPALAHQYDGVNPLSGTWWLTFTPVHLVWAGSEAVVIFFVLSGIVLTLPYVRPGRPGRQGTWAGYYVRRLVRLYPPVAVSLVLAAILVAVFPRHPVPGVSWWFAAHDVPVTRSGLLHDLLLLDGVGWVDGVLWSLRYEVAFSLLLPLVVLVARRMPARVELTLPAALALVLLGHLSSDPFAQWLPYFLVGAALAAGWDRLSRLGERIAASSWSVVVWTGLATASGILLLTEWWLRGRSLPPTTFTVVAPPFIALGAALLCFLAVACPEVRRLVSGRTLQWAGRISFSLYLVHEPIVVSVSSLVGPSVPGVALTLLGGGGVAVGVAVVFHRVVEQPSLRLARRVGARLDGRGRAAPPVVSTLPAGGSPAATTVRAA